MYLSIALSSRFIIIIVVVVYLMIWLVFRRLFYINWYPAFPTIMTLSTSGGDPYVLIDSELERPSALTIDYNMADWTGGRLFWVDQNKNSIESCNHDGTDRTVMFSLSQGTCCALASKKATYANSTFLYVACI